MEKEEFKLMKTFKAGLLENIKGNLYNNFGGDNYDEHRFGPFKSRKASPISEVKNAVKKGIRYKNQERALAIAERFKDYYKDLDFIYQHLDKDDRQLLVEIIAYRLMGFSKVKLPTNNPGYQHALQLAESARVGNETYDPGFMHFILNKYELNTVGYDATLFFSDVGIAIDFIIEQYACKKNGTTIVGAEEGDIVLDAGGCWGDTALYFGTKVGNEGKVFSFEFIPGNIQLFNKNIDLNPHMKDRISLVNRPVSEISNVPLYFRDNGPGSSVKVAPFPEQSGETSSISIDDFVEAYKLPTVDFIKMDIEGAELDALKGAINTIKKFRPKLAIAIYHSMHDFVQIPKWILNLDLGYELHLGHFTIHAEETVIFAKPKKA